MQLESSAHALHRSDVESRFIDAVQQRLPKDAFDELRRLPLDQYHMPRTEEAVRWARKWGVNAPVILKELVGWCDGSKTAAYSFPAVPESWTAILRELTAKPPTLMRWSPVPVIDQKDEPPGLPDETRRQLHALRRENAAKQFEAALLPLSADPVHETSDQFLFRAREHWNARVSLGKKHGLRPAFGGRKWHEFDRALEWLLKFQIDRVTFNEIAERPSAKPAVESRSASGPLAEVRASAVVERRQP
jgi:hypothetical protein